MSQNLSDFPIFIVSDSIDEARSMRKMLCEAASGAIALDEAGGLRLFEERRPGLVVLAFQEIEKSERFYLTLFRQIPNIREMPHRTLLLCSTTDAAAAYSLCRAGTVDDYFVARPVHDPMRLQLAVVQGQERHAAVLKEAALKRQFAHVGADRKHLDDFVNKALRGGQCSQTEALQAFLDFAGRLGQHFDQFEQRMGNPAHDGLREHFSQMRRGGVEPDTRRVEGKLREAEAALQKLGDGYAANIDPLRQQEFPPAEPEVLLVDDDDVYREMVGALLEEAGLRVHQADGGEAALAAMRLHRPDIVLLDYNMPGMDGIATLRLIKDDPELREVPVVLLTGVSARETVKEVIVAGAAGYIVKPSNRPTILAKIRNLLPKKD